MNLIWLLRASRWARRPPSAGRVKLVLVVVAAVLVLVAVERWVGWPDALTPAGDTRPRLTR